MSEWRIVSTRRRDKRRFTVIETGAWTEGEFAGREANGCNTKRNKVKQERKERPHTHICLDRSWRCLLQRGVAATRRLRVASAPEARRTSRPATRTRRITRSVSSTRKCRREVKRIPYMRAPNTWTAVRMSKTPRRTRRRTRPFKRRRDARLFSPSSPPFSLPLSRGENSEELSRRVLHAMPDFSGNAVSSGFRFPAKRASLPSNGTLARIGKPRSRKHTPSNFFHFSFPGASKIGYFNPVVLQF